jgi:hypothetical protein
MLVAQHHVARFDERGNVGDDPYELLRQDLEEMLAEQSTDGFEPAKGLSGWYLGPFRFRKPAQSTALPPLHR